MDLHVQHLTLLQFIQSRKGGPSLSVRPSVTVGGGMFDQHHAPLSDSLAFLRRADRKLFAAKVPPGRHVETHIGQDHQVLQEGKDGVHCGGEGKT